MLLQMALFHFLWLSNIPFYLYTTFSLSISPADGHLDYFLFGCCKWCCSVYWSACIFSNCGFLWIYAPGGGILDHMVVHFYLFIFLKWRSEVKSFSRVPVFVTPWTVPYRAPPSTGFCMQEYWSGLPFLSPGDLPTQGSNPGLPRCRQMLFFFFLEDPLYYSPHSGCNSSNSGGFPFLPTFSIIYCS